MIIDYHLFTSLQSLNSLSVLYLHILLLFIFFCEINLLFVKYFNDKHLGCLFEEIW